MSGALGRETSFLHHKHPGEIGWKITNLIIQATFTCSAQGNFSRFCLVLLCIISLDNAKHTPLD